MNANFKKITAEARRRLARKPQYENRRTLSKATTSSGLAAGCCPSRGFGATLLRDNGINHSARNNALDTSLGGSSCAAKCIRGFAEQGIHISGPAFVRTEMNC